MPPARRRLLGLLAILVLALATGAGTRAASGVDSPQAQSGLSFTAFGPTDYLRETGKPATIVTPFSVRNPAASYTLQIFNGGLHGQYDRVSSAVITLNAVQVAGPSDFNQHVARIDRPVVPLANNSLSVEPRRKPG